MTSQFHLNHAPFRAEEKDERAKALHLGRLSGFRDSLGCGRGHPSDLDRLTGWLNNGGIGIKVAASRLRR